MNANEEYLKRAEGYESILDKIRYFKEVVLNDFKALFNDKDLFALPYNDQITKEVLKRLSLSDDFKKIAGTWVYAMRELKRELAKLEEEQEILSRGYVRITGFQKELDSKKVKGIFSVPKIGLLGSFDSLEEQEGTLKYSGSYNCLMLIPKGHRTRGFLIKDKAYIKTEEAS